METNNEKRKNRPGQGRKFKMTDRLVEKFEKIVTSNKIAFLTNKDLVFLLNKELEPHERIDERTFKNWIAGKCPENKTAEKFSTLYQEALIYQKQGLIEKILEGGDKYWYRMGWLLERKFSDEYNLKHTSEVKHTSEKTINIIAANDEQKNLIDNVINVDFVDVPAKRISIYTLMNSKRGWIRILSTLMLIINNNNV